MSSEQPFHHLFESLGRLPHSHADSINQPAYQALLDTLSVPLDHSSRCILLRAPRAGYGKTHLLSRLQHHLTASHEFIPLHPATGSRVDAASVTDDALRRVGSPLPAGGGLCGLDLAVRRLFALALQPLVISGEVPCLDREGALSSLRYRPVETFDFHHPNAVTARWIRDNFEVLGPRLTLELAQLTGLNPRAVGFWVDALFRFAVTPVEAPGRVDALAQTALSASPGDGVAMERLSALLALLSLLTRVVLVADDVEGFSADETAALRLAAFLGSLRQSAERVDVILSLNRDVWDSAFVPRLSGGLIDRLSEVVIELEPQTEVQMVAILDSRAPGLGVRVLEYMRAEGLEPYARGVLRAAGAAWLRALREPSVPVVPEPPVLEPPPPAALATPPYEAPPAPLATAVAPTPAATAPEPVQPPADQLPPPVVPSFEAPLAASSLPDVLAKDESPPLWWTPISNEPPPQPQFTDLIPTPETASASPDLENLLAEPPAPPAALDEATASPFHPLPEPPAWQPPAPAETPPQSSPFIVPATPAAPVASEIAETTFRDLAEPPAWQPPAAVEAPLQASPFIVPATPAPPPVSEAAVESPFRALADAASWQPPIAAEPPQPASPFMVPATPAVPTASEIAEATFRNPAEPPAWQPPVASESAAPPSPFTVPTFGGEPAHPSVAAWHEVTGPTAPFDSHPPPAAPAQPPPLPPAAAEPPPIDQDRVEDLLRQFRERYSRPNP